jgi:hypothetical protein
MRKSDPPPGATNESSLPPNPERNHTVKTLAATLAALAITVTTATAGPMITKDVLAYSAVLKLHYATVCKDSLALTPEIIKDAAATYQAMSEIERRVAMTNVLVDIKTVGGEKRFCAAAEKKLRQAP